MREVWIWQSVVSPHVAGLASALAENCRKVVYLAEQAMSDERARQGWAPSSVGPARLELVPTEAAVRAVVDCAPADSIHLCQGIRSNGLVGAAQRELASRQFRQWVVMETVDDSGWRGIVKRLEYARLFRTRRRMLQGVLATGWRTPGWVVARGMPPERVFPFAYFLQQSVMREASREREAELFRFLFVGQLIARKQVGLLIEALGLLSTNDFELVIAGDGPCGQDWQRLAEARIPGQIRWLGRVPMAEVSEWMALADCLVLPSRHDGWGAVVSEALMVGTPVVCSDACGSAGVVRASGVGGVFKAGDREDLAQRLGEALKTGRLTPHARRDLAVWARALGADAGAAYLRKILDYADCGGSRPVPPWEQVGNGGKGLDRSGTLL